MPNFPTAIRTILTQARHGQEAEYENLSKPQQMVIDKDVQNVVDAAVSCVGEDQIPEYPNRSETYMISDCDREDMWCTSANSTKDEIRAKLRGKEQV